MVENDSRDPDIFGEIPIATEPSDAPGKDAGEPVTPPKKVFPSQRRKSPGLARQLAFWLLVIPALLFGLYLVVGFIVVPYAAERLIPARISAALDRDVTIGRTRFDPFTLQLTLYNGIVGPKRSDPGDPVDPLLSFSKVAVNFEIYSLIARGVVCKNLDIDSFFLHLVRLQGNTYNVGQVNDLKGIFDRERKFSINNINIVNSRILFDDRISGKEHQVSDIQLALPTLATVSYHADQYVTPQFSARINGSPVEFSGETTVADGSVAARLQLRLTDLDLPAYLNSLTELQDFKVKNGSGSLDLELVFAFNPAGSGQFLLRGNGVFSEVLLLDAGGQEISIPRLETRAEIMPLERKITFQEIRMEKPEMHVARLVDGRWSFAGAAESSRLKAFACTIDRLQLVDGTIYLIDRKVPGGFADTWKNISFTLQQYSSAAAEPAAFALSGLNQNKARISAQGNFHPQLQTFEGYMVVNSLPLTSFAPYFSLNQGVRWQDGLLERLESEFSIVQSAAGRQWKINLHGGTLQVKNMVLSKQQKELVVIPGLTGSNLLLDSLEKKFHVEKLTAEIFSMDIERDHGGTWQLAGYAPSQKHNWQFSADTVAFDHGNLSFTDVDNPGHAVLLTQVSMTGKNFSTGFEQRGTISLAGRLGAPTTPAGPSPGKDQVAVSGEIVLNPLGADLDCTVEDYALAARKTLFFTWLNLPATMGKLTARGKLVLPEAAFRGDIDIINFRAHQQDSGSLGLRQCRLSGAVISSRPFAVRAEKCLLASPYLRFSLDESGKFSLGDIVADPAAKDADLPAIAFDTVEFGKGLVIVDDRSVTPAFTGELHNVSGTMGPVTNAGNQNIAIDLQAVFQKTSPLTISGTTRFPAPFGATSLDITVDDLDLKSLSPYLAPHLGYEIVDGLAQIKGRVAYAENGVSGENNLVISNLTFGKKVAENSRAALAVSLLTDTEGVVAVQLPFSSASGDEKFPCRSALARGFRNLLLKTAVSPYALVNHLVPGELVDVFTFPFGQAELMSLEQKNLADLLSVLLKRPGLAIALKGFVDGSEDRSALQRKLEQQRSQQKKQQVVELTRQLSQNYGSEEVVSPVLIPEKAVSFADLPVTVEDELLVGLARRRAEVIRRFLVESGLADARIRLEENIGFVPAGSPGRPGNRVEVSLHPL